MNSFSPYHYATLDGRETGVSTSRARARQNAAAIARRTGNTVRLIDPERGSWLIVPMTPNRARWFRDEQEDAA